MARYSNDPRWITARFDGACRQAGCSEVIRRGDRAYYYPDGKLMFAERCGHGKEHALDFNAAAFDEDRY